MASLHNYQWRNLSVTQTDTLASVVSRFLSVAGYADASTFIDAIRAQNPALLDWQNIPDTTTVLVPFIGP